MSDAPKTVRLLRDVGVPLHDRTRLSARIWLPEDTEKAPVPAVLEYVPYRKNDWYARGDSTIHPYFAEHGYAAVRVDIRGSGDSDGILRDEYLPQEQEDACELIAWLTEQPWCSGRVGMIGFSWGGFAALQVASLRPPGLAAIIPCHFTHNRYTTDAHYIGGCVLASEMLSWSTTMLAYQALPPDPESVGETVWAEMWHRRLEAAEPFVHHWLSHQRYDEYWRHGSVCEDYAAISCAVYAVGGAADSYVDAVPYLLEGLSCPKKGLIGPWAHYYPFAIDPGPRIGFLQECIRWWDHWLKGIDNGIMREPMLTVWVSDPAASDVASGRWAGKWIGELSWPSPEVSLRRMSLGENTLGDKAEETGIRTRAKGEPDREATKVDEESVLRIVGNQAAGLECGLWCPLGTPFDLPPDQRREDGMALCFTSSPLPTAIDVVGYPTAILALSADRPVAFVAVRLCDVAPDGTSSLVSRGVLNMTHRDGHDEPSPLVPGKVYEVSVSLKMTATTVAAEHRLRLAVSPTYWPWAWPSPEPVCLSVFTRDSYLSLPVSERHARDGAPRLFEEPECAVPLACEVVASAPSDWRLHHDVVTGRHELEIRLAPLSGDSAAGRIRLLDTNLEIEELQHDRYSIVADDPLSARVDCHRSLSLERQGWAVRVDVHSTMTADGEVFRLVHVLEATEGSSVVAARSWDRTVPRELL